MGNLDLFKFRMGAELVTARDSVLRGYMYAVKLGIEKALDCFFQMWTSPSHSKSKRNPFAHSTFVLQGMYFSLGWGRWGWNSHGTREYDILSMRPTPGFWDKLTNYRSMWIHTTTGSLLGSIVTFELRGALLFEYWADCLGAEATRRCRIGALKNQVIVAKRTYQKVFYVGLRDRLWIECLPVFTRLQFPAG